MPSIDSTGAVGACAAGVGLWHTVIIGASAATASGFWGFN